MVNFHLLILRVSLHWRFCVFVCILYCSICQLIRCTLCQIH